MKKILLVLSLMLCTIGLTGCGESKISEEKAQEIALKDAGVDTADTTSMHVGYEDMGESDAHYQVIFQTKDAQYNYDINAKTGAIVSKNYEPNLN